MKRYSIFLALFLLAPSLVKAGLPPTTVKGQSDATPSVTFNLQVPQSQATRINATTALLETGNSNTIANPGAEGTTISAAAYADAAAASPVDGTGGSPTITITRTTSSPLSGVGSYLITKDAANRQGEGVSFPFTIDRSMLAKQVSVSFDYETASGTYDAGSDTTDPDLTAWVYGPTDGTPTLTQLAPYKVLGCVSGVICRFQANMQTAISGVAYRLILHESKTGTSAYTFKLDNVTVEPVSRTYGAPVTDWVSISPTVNWSAGLGSITARIRRVGDSMQGQLYIKMNGAATNAALIWTLPNGWSADTAKIASGGSLIDQEGSNLGTATSYDASTGNYYSASPTLDSATGIIFTTSVGSASAFVAQTAPMTWAAGDVFTAFINIPIAGWASTVQLSQDSDSRVVAARGTNTAGTSIADVTDTLIPLVVTFDTHGAQLATTGVYTAPVPGKYRFDGVITFQDSLGVGTTVDLIFKKNGSTVRVVRTVSDEAGSQYWSASGSDVADLNAGDTIGVYARQNSGTSKVLSSTTGHNTFSITRLSGSASIAASETVAAGYYLNADTAFNSTQINYDTKDYDTHNAVTTGASWKFTAPMSGLYRVCATNYYSSGSSSDVVVTKNGTNYARIAQIGTSVTSSYPGCIELKLLSAEYVDLRTNASITLKGLISSVRTTFVNISRVGTY